MCVRVFFCVVLSCVGRGLASGRSPVQGVLPTVQQIHKFQKINSEPEQAKRSSKDDDGDDDDKFTKSRIFFFFFFLRTEIG
jgi:hypothetical protein